MKVLQKSIMAVATMLSLIGFTIPASADTQTSASVITIKATVLPASYVIVDQTGSITKILSNTASDVNPKVYLQNVTAAHATSLTPQILKQYQALVPSGTNHVGVVYDRAQLSALQLLKHSRQ